MHFEPCDAERIAAWKGQISAGNATKEGLRAEITCHFVLHSTHDPDTILTHWNKISVDRMADGSWMAALAPTAGELS